MAVLTVTIKEELTLNGSNRGSENITSIASVTQSFNRIVTLPANGGSGNTETTVAVFRDLVSTNDGAIDDGDAKYIRVTNLDSDNSVTLSLQIALLTAQTQLVIRQVYCLLLVRALSWVVLRMQSQLMMTLLHRLLL